MSPVATSRFAMPTSSASGRRSVARRLGLLVALAALAAVWVAPAARSAENAPQLPRVGRAMKIVLPISEETARRVQRFSRRALEKAAAQKQWPVLIFEFAVPTGQGQFGRGSDFGACYKLADFLSNEELNAATTVAFIPKSIQGHAVLVAAACEDVVMPADAEIGQAGVDEKRLTPTMLSAYKEIADRRKNIPTEVALAMLDPTRELVEAETETARVYTSPAGLEELRKKHTIKGSRTVKAAGQPGLFSGAEGRQLTFVKYHAAERRAVARAFNLPPESVEEDPSIDGGWRPIRVDLKGPVQAESADKVERMIREAVTTREVNFVCLWINSPGGSLADSLRLATFLAAELEPGRVRTVAYVAEEARGDAALVALACDHLVIRPQAVLGGAGAADSSDEEVRQAERVLRETIAPRKSRSWSLPAAIINPKLDVFRYARGADVEYFSESEAAEQPARGEWQRGERVSTPGAPLQVTGRQAVDYHLATKTVEDFQELRVYYGLQDDPELLEPGWADELIDALASPALGALLLTVAFVAMYIELQMPGIGIGGFISAVCFAVFFWSRFLGGTAGWLEVILFVTGLAFVLLEVFVLPGFGVFGLGGGALILASLVLASQTFIFSHNAYQLGQFARSLWMVGGAVLGVLVGGAILRRWLPRAPVFGHVLLSPPTGDEAATIGRREALVDLDALIGSRGVAATPLMPGGKARFGNRLIDVVAEGEAVPRGADVVVVEVHGNRIVVQPAK